MNLKLTILLCLGLTVLSNAQVALTPNSNILLLAPELIQDNSTEIALFYLNDYKEIKAYLEEEKALLLKENENAKKKRKYFINIELTSLNEDIALLEEYISYWEEECAMLPAMALLEEDKCYTLETDAGILSKDQYELEIDEEESTFAETFEVQTKKVGQWVRKRKSPNCYSQNPEDCYVACYESKLEAVAIKFGEEIFYIKELPVSYEFDEGNSIIKRDIVLTKKDIKIFLDSDQELNLVDAIEVDCE